MNKQKQELPKNSTVSFRCILFLLAGFLILLCLQRAAAPDNAGAAADPPDLQNDFPASYMITAKNRFAYQGGLECSGFSSAYLLRHFGEAADGVELFKTFPGKTPDGGASPYGIVTFFENRDYQIEYKCDGTIENLKKEVSKGTPVIVFIRVYEHTFGTHYVPLIGYDKEYFYLAESLPYMANCRNEKNLPYNRKIKIADFKRLWANINGRWRNPYFIIAKKTPA